MVLVSGVPKAHDEPRRVLHSHPVGVRQRREHLPCTAPDCDRAPPLIKMEPPQVMTTAVRLTRRCAESGTGGEGRGQHLPTRRLRTGTPTGVCRRGFSGRNPAEKRRKSGHCEGTPKGDWRSGYGGGNPTEMKQRGRHCAGTPTGNWWGGFGAGNPAEMKQRCRHCEGTPTGDCRSGFGGGAGSRRTHWADIFSAPPFPPLRN